MAALTNLLGRDEVDFVVINKNNNNNSTSHYEKNIKQQQQQQQQQKLNGKYITEVEFIDTKTKDQNENVPNTNINTTKTTKKIVPNKNSTITTTTTTTTSTTPNLTMQKTKKQTKSDEDTHKKHKISLFTFSKKHSHKSNNKDAEQQHQQQQQQQPAENSIEKQQTMTTINTVNSLNGLNGMKPLHDIPIGTPPRQHKFVKSSSIARLLGNTYNAKKFEKEEQKRKAHDSKFHTYAGQRRRDSGPYLERFKNSKDIDNADMLSNNSGIITLTTDTRELYENGTRNELISMEKVQKIDHNSDLGTKAMRTLTRGLGKLWWKRSHSVDISAPDPEYKVSYLGNVLTGWAKGEGCVEKQLNTLWRNYTQNNKPDVLMRIKVCASGLKATTRQHGLTEYWANRITHCCAPKNYPRVFCWIYRHEGRKLKHELRCHAVLCSKEKIVQEICETLKENLETALREFKREKILKQNARLSLANAVYDNPSLPRRKILLSVGGNNYRPPLERSKSAPKLTAIEEAIGEEEGEDAEETNEPEMKSCCQKDSLYPAMTLGRRHCRRGHSIRRTGKVKAPFDCATLPKTKEKCCGNAIETKCSANSEVKQSTTTTATEDEQRRSYGSDESDEFDKLLLHNNYDANASLATELMPYFDMQLHKNTSCSLGSLSELKDNDGPLSIIQTINSDPSAHPNAEFNPNDDHHDMHDDHDDDDHAPIVGLRRNGVCSDGEEDYLDADDLYFRQTSILNMLHRNSMRKMAALNLSSDESSLETHTTQPMQYRHQAQSSICSNASSTTTDASSTAGIRKQTNLDSDEGSISSGCETASTVTANQDDLSLNYRQSKATMDMQQNEYGILDEEPITVDDIYKRLESRLQGRHSGDTTTFSSSSSITLKMGTSPDASMQNGLDACDKITPPCAATTPTTTTIATSVQRSKRIRKHSMQRSTGEHDTDTDSECSDESGYVEYQERAQKQTIKNNINATTTIMGEAIAADIKTKPQLPPKPMPRRSIATTTTTTVPTTTAV